MGKNMISRRLGLGEREVLLFLHTPLPPSRDEWGAMMGDLLSYAEKNEARRIVTLVVSDGGGPDVSMRAEMLDYFKRYHLHMKTSVVTVSRFVRGIVSAVSWFNPQIRAFTPSQLLPALTHLGMSAGAKPRLLQELAEMERELVPNACFQAIKDAEVAHTGA